MNILSIIGGIVVLALATAGKVRMMFVPDFEKDKREKFLWNELMLSLNNSIPQEPKP